MRKFILALLLALACPSLSWGAFSVVAGRCDGQTLGDGSDLVTTQINTTGADLIIAYTSQYTTGATLTDSYGNTWTPLTEVGTGTEHGKMWYTWGAISVGSGHDFTFSAGGGLFNAFVCTLALSGAMTASNPFDSEVTNENSGTTIQTGSITPSVDNAVVVTGLSTNNTGNAPTINSGFTVQATVTGGASDGGGLAYLIQTTASMVNPTWDVVNNQSNRTTIASFKTFVGAPPPAAGNVRVIFVE